MWKLQKIVLKDYILAYLVSNFIWSRLSKATFGNELIRIDKKTLLAIDKIELNRQHIKSLVFKKEWSNFNNLKSLSKFLDSRDILK